MSSIIDRMQSVASSPPFPAVTGRWFNIRICPDLALGELLNVGIGFTASDSEETHIRLVDQFDRFRLRYGREFEEELRMMLRVLRSTGLQDNRNPPFPNVRFSELKFAAGNSLEEILDRLFRATVPVTTFPAGMASRFV